MKPSVLKEVLVKAFQNRQKILITEVPGIGKSDITCQASKATEEIFGNGVGPQQLVVAHQVIYILTPIFSLSRDFWPRESLLSNSLGNIDSEEITREDPSRQRDGKLTLSVAR